MSDESVQLAPLTIDAADRMAGWMTDREITDNLGLRSAPSLARTRHWLEHAVGDPSIAAFAILANGQHVGNVVLDQIDAHLASARLSIYLAEAGRGRGVGSAALLAAIDAGFNDVHLNRIWLLVHSANSRAIAAYTRVGFTVEGVARDGFRLRGRLVPALLMSVLARDHQANRPQ